MQEQDRLKIESCHISEDKSNIWSTGDRPVRLQIDHPVPILLQLLAGFLCNSRGRVPTDMDRPERLCQPTLEPHRQGSSTYCH